MTPRAALRLFLVRSLNAILLRADLVDIVNAIGNSGRRIGHVRAWSCTGRQYANGDAVPHLRNVSTYSVPTVEGWWINVVDGRIESWSAKPVMDTVGDLYGRVRRPTAGRRRSPRCS